MEISLELCSETLFYLDIAFKKHSVGTEKERIHFFSKSIAIYIECYITCEHISLYILNLRSE